MELDVSIITICYNNLNEVVNTCTSVDIQLVKPYEHVIIDGSSNNEIAKYLSNTLQPVYRKWLTERDKGIADAFNKGIKLAGGNILVMLNAGDQFYDEFAIQNALEAFKNNPDIQWLHGKYKIFRGGKWVIIGKPFESSKVYRGMRSLCHQTMFVRKALHDKYGLYSLDFKIAMDYDFVVRIAFEKMFFIDTPLVVFEPEGTSSTNYLVGLQEAKKVYELHLGKSWKLILWQTRLKILYYILNSPIGKTLYAIKVWLKLENL